MARLTCICAASSIARPTRAPRTATAVMLAAALYGGCTELRSGSSTAVADGSSVSNTEERADAGAPSATRGQPAGGLHDGGGATATEPVPRDASGPTMADGDAATEGASSSAGDAAIPGEVAAVSQAGSGEDADPAVDAGRSQDGAVDLCAQDNGGCDPLVTCASLASAVTCGSCPDGYAVEEGTRCVDIDECAFDNGGCQERCDNAAGTHSCACGLGRDLKPDGRTCRGWQPARSFAPSSIVGQLDIEITSPSNAHALFCPDTGGLVAVIAYKAGAWEGMWKPLSTEGMNGCSNLDIQVDANGDAFAAWASSLSAETVTTGIWAARYIGGAWQAAVKLDFGATSMTVFNRVDSPHLALAGPGNAFMVWSRKRLAQFSASGTWELIASRITGDAWEPAAAIPDATMPYNALSLGSRGVVLAASGAGTAVTGWEQNYNTVMASRFAGGTWTSSLLESELGKAAAPQVALDGGSKAMAIWQQHDNISREDVWGSRNLGTGWAAAGRIEQDDRTSAGAPRLAIGKDGNGCAVWRHDRHIRASRFDDESWHVDTRISPDYAAPSDPTIALDADGHAFVLWLDDNACSDCTQTIWFSRFADDKWSEPAPLRSEPSARLYTPAITVGPVGYGFAWWLEDHAGQREYWISRYE